MFSKRPGEHVGVPLLSLCTGHFGKVLENSSSRQKGFFGSFLRF